MNQRLQADENALLGAGLRSSDSSQRVKPAYENKPFIAAVNRCASPKSRAAAIFFAAS
jgi:hypothetical protein